MCDWAWISGLHKSTTTIDSCPSWRSSSSGSPNPLPNLPENHKCRRLHGHSFRVEIHVSGPLTDKEGWIMDFADVTRAFNPIYEQLDHHYLNYIPGLET